ncbi:hypothetical protein RDI58_026783 [Solanum bulbocastanum]|uniref:Uncharacterized protein n=1 Tax=Solanum bulbocastanum TaxID=147425 RepID=A0AAN8Y1S3_SOLBU
MSQSAAPKKKGSNPNKAQSPLKNLNFDMQYRSRKSKLLDYKSVIHSSSMEELGTSHMVVGKGQTKKNLFQSEESIQQKGIKLPMHNFRFQTSSNKGVTALVHVTGETLADDLGDQEEIGADECAIDEEIGIDCGTKVEGKKWVMTSLRDAWRRHKQKIKERFFDKDSTVEDMLAKRPDDMPEEQFRQLIEYWKHPTVQA